MNRRIIQAACHALLAAIAILSLSIGARAGIEAATSRTKDNETPAAVAPEDATVETEASNAEQRLLEIYDLDRILPRPSRDDSSSGDEADERDEPPTADQVDVLLRIDAEGRAVTADGRTPGQAARMLADLVRGIAEREDPTIECDPVGRTLVVRGTAAGQAATRNALAGVQRAMRERAIEITGKVLRFKRSASEIVEMLGLPAVAIQGLPKIGAVTIDPKVVEQQLESRADRVSELDIGVTARAFQRWTTEGRNIYYYVSNYEEYDIEERGPLTVPIVETITDGVSVELVTLGYEGGDASVDTVLVELALRLSTLHRPIPTFTTNVVDKENSVTTQLPEVIQLPEVTETLSRATLRIRPGETVLVGPGRVLAASSAKQPASNAPTYLEVPIEEVLVIVLSARLVER